MIPPDAELLQEYVLHGAEDAFQQILERYSGFVFSICRRKLGSADLAEDATQTVFTRLVSTAARLEPGPLNGYLAEVALRVCKDINKSRSRRDAHRTRLTERFRIMHLPEEPDPRIPALNQALGQLRKSQQDVVMLRHIEGMGIEAVAEALDLSPQAVRKRLVRAMADLRAWMEGQGFALSLGITAELLHELRFPPPAGLSERIAHAIATGSAGTPVGSGLGLYMSERGAHLVIFGVIMAALIAAAIMPHRDAPSAVRTAVAPKHVPEPPLLRGPQAASVQARLQMQLPHLWVDGGNLEGTLLILSRWGGVRISARWDELRAQHVTQSEPVEADLANMTLAKALDTLLNRVSPDGKLRYEISGDGVLIRANHPAIAKSE